MNKAYVYILYSHQLHRYYIGSTQLDVHLRQERHITDYYGPRKYTSKATDWELYYELECCNRKQAQQIEKHIKRMKSKKYIENLAQYPEIAQKLILRYT